MDIFWCGFSRYMDHQKLVKRSMYYLHPENSWRRLHIILIRILLAGCGHGIHAEEVNPDFLQRRLKQAVELRRKMADLIPSNAMRLVHGESDGLTWINPDQYDDVFVVQFLTAGMEFWRDSIVGHYPKNIRMQALSMSVLMLMFANWKDYCQRPVYFSEKQSDIPLMIMENGLHIRVDIINGHKTGYYLDQRDNRLSSEENIQRIERC